MALKGKSLINVILYSIIVPILLVAIITGNVLCGIYYEMITVYFGGYGTKNENLDPALGTELCEEIEAEGIVLLKNQNNTLPLTDTNKVCVFGWGATDGGFITSGAGSGSSEDRGSGVKVTFLTALEEAGFEYFLPLISKYQSYKDKRDMGDYWNQAYPFFNLIEPPVAELLNLMSSAKGFSDTAIVVISRLGGEAQDIPKEQRKWNLPTDTSRTYLQLSTEEEAMLNQVKNNFDKVIIILNTCNAMELGWIEDDLIDAVLLVGATGQSGTIAIGKVLNGEITPSGRTVDIYAYDHTTAATYANSPNAREANSPKGSEKSYTNGGYYIDYAESIYVGYKWYETADAEHYWDDKGGYENIVQFPFGFGLSYTTFDWKVTSVEPASGSVINENTEIKITLEVTNTGNVKGQDVVQVYYTPPYYKGGIEKSAVNLCAFAKTITLLPGNVTGSTQILTLTFKAEDMKSYDYNDANENGFIGYELEHGTYEITLRNDSHNVADIEGATITYTISNDITMPTDTVTGYPVVNRFTGDNADDGISIDGTNSNANIQFLTREDFEGTFPQITTTRRAKDSKILALANNWQNQKRNTTIMPIQGEAGDLKLRVEKTIENENGEPEVIKVPNPDLVPKLGNPDNFDDDELWEPLLNQITVQELITLVQGSGYRTAKIESIDKPEVTDIDGPSGLNDTNMTAASKAYWTSFPVETVIAQTWNARLAFVFGYAVGYEAAITKVGGWYAPGANIHRSPFCGRNFEYYSEDPYLSGVMASETINGATNNGLYCYIKHFVVNETEFNRKELYTWLTEQALREIYLKPFEMSVKNAKANAVMTSFNRIGATWTGGSYSLLTEILRNEWGFKGTVVTDYTEGGNYMSVDQGIRAGNDTWLNGRRTDNLPYGGFNDKSTATAVSCMRAAAKNVIFTYCNTIYRWENYESSGEEARFQAQLVDKEAGRATPYWLIWLALLDLAVASGVTVWTIFFVGSIKKSKRIM